MRCLNYYPLVSASESNSVNPCFIAVLLYALNALSALAAAYNVYNIDQKVGSVYKQSFSYRLRIIMLVLYNISLIAYLFAIESQVFFYAVMSNLFVNAVCFFPLYINEVLSSIIPHGVLLYSSFAEVIIFGVLAIQGFSGGDAPFNVTSYCSKVLELSLTFSSLIIFVLEFSYYRPSVDLINFYLSRGLPTEIPNAISRFTFTYMNPMIVKNFDNSEFSIRDLAELPPSLTSDHNYAKIDKQWRYQLESEKQSLSTAIFKSFGTGTALTFLYSFLRTVGSFAQPQLFRLLIQSVGDNSKTLLAKLLICFSMLVCAILQTIFANAEAMQSVVVGNGVKASMMRLIYNKSMRLSPDSKNLKSTGSIISLISVDSDIVSSIFYFAITNVVMYPVAIVFCLVSLYFLLGNAMWSGLVIMALVIMANSKIIAQMMFYQNRHLTRKDIRTSLVSDLLGSIKSVKLFSWEMPMLKHLKKARDDDELGDLVIKGKWEALGGLLTEYVPYLICGTSFYLFSLLYPSAPLTADIIFPAIALFGLLEKPVRWFPDALADLSEFSISVHRIKEFLLMDEVEVNLTRDSGFLPLEVKNANFLWSKKDQNVALHDINYSVRPGHLSCIVGKVGSGKTAFLKAVLGELPIVNSDTQKPLIYHKNGYVAYCGQVPWILNSTVKQNILFNHEYDEAYYQLVLECCDLDRDILTFEDLDNTLVGDKGISLSGGQKARLSLARALYARADIYIMDDILSAVDSHVGAKLISRIFDKKSGILANKTTILATNNFKVLKCADEIILLDHETIAESGSLEEVLNNDSKLSSLIKSFSSGLDNEVVLKAVPEISEPASEAKLEAFDKELMLSRLTHNDNSKKSKGHERSEFGKVDWSIYVQYAKACGVNNVVVMFVFMILAPLAKFGDTYWLKHWSEINSEAGETTDVIYYLSVYALIAVVIGLLVYLTTIFLRCVCSLSASKALHNRLAESMVRAPMQFFETTPLGRILNRFTGDINVIDMEIPFTFRNFFLSVVNIITIFLVISYNLPVFILIFICLFFVYHYYQKFFVGLSREVKRLMSISRSPIISHIGEAIAGDETIRAYNQASRFDCYVSLLLDNNMKTIYNNASLARWIAVRLEFIGAIVIFGVAVISVFSEMSPVPLGSALVGLLISYSLSITENLNVFVRMIAQVESEIVSVERIVEYCEVPSEAPLINPLHRAPRNWPSKGVVEFQEYSTSYRADLKPVLKNLSFKINSLEKVGVVGRTGAGKSTLAQSLFRLLEPTQGSIVIDDIKIDDLGLFDLRHNLNIIPQNSQAFQGTVRSNLDPFGEYSSSRLLRALQLSHFDEFLVTQNDILDYSITENGSNLSVGQRQLLCLARALLNQSKVLVLDEATAAIDMETDKIVQETIRTAFKDRTIITIAHRLDTILDYDKVLVLDEGEIKEFDTLEALLERKDSLFYRMCEKAGLR